MVRNKLLQGEKQSVTIHFRLKQSDATLIRLAYKISGDKNLSAFIYRQIIPVSQSIVDQHKKVVLNETIRK